MYSLLIVSQRHVVREGLAAILQASPDLRILAKVSTASVAQGLPQRPAPDVILYDTGTSLWLSLRGLRPLHRHWPSARVLGFVVAHSDLVEAALSQAGLPHWLSDETPPDQLVTHVLRLARGEVQTDTATSSAKAQDYHGLNTLTPREHCVLEMLAQGCPNKEIANRLGLRELTVKSYLKVIYGKLQVTNRVEAAGVWQGWGGSLPLDGGMSGGFPVTDSRRVI